MTAPEHEDTVIHCRGCSQNRLCHHYRGLWICDHCWRKRKAIHATDLYLRKQTRASRGFRRPAKPDYTPTPRFSPSTSLGGYRGRA